MYLQDVRSERSRTCLNDGDNHGESGVYHYLSRTRALDVINTLHESSSNPELAILLGEYLDGGLTIDGASPEELVQLRNHFYMRRTDLDNEHYQYQNGFLDPDFYETTTKREIRAYAPHWRAFAIPEPRQQFAEEVERILADPAVKSALE